MRGERDRSRSERRWSSDRVVLAAFGTADPARLTDFIVAAANGVARGGLPVSVLNLGAGAPALRGLDPSIELVHPGAMASEEVARQLAAADIFLAPYADGLSTRRTSLMAALQHGLPIVGTSGKSTDAMLLERRDTLVLTSDADTPGFADAALRLAHDRSAREELGGRGRALYGLQFDWPVLAERLERSLAT
jgi:glycosyltransferase involved in cell wall biosynthesis